MQYLPWIISAVSIAQIWLAGNKNEFAWLLTLFNQGIWLAFIFDTKEWGLLPVTVAYTVIAVRNHFKWNREALVRETIDSVTRSAPVPETAPAKFWQDAGSGK